MTTKKPAVKAARKPVKKSEDKRLAVQTKAKSDTGMDLLTAKQKAEIRESIYTKKMAAIAAANYTVKDIDLTATVKKLVKDISEELITGDLNDELHDIVAGALRKSIKSKLNAK